ncbi:peptidylprolyl isomerase [Guyparkeria hydrothermalis]|uniref:Peptidyl-prolyl cis-trans isomerase n=1 Tax=Guyparkeria halophila TaxID=47960 RepID=A0A6I6D5G4_9GAMM|nr:MULTISPECIES: peptidylprolyl isomerase [Guyparkeria]MCL7750756.1 peptidylprolyl isomerase [Guyparkeria hydrothermalis]QGT79253.1 peptidylprolyl isomerase [Guyparkeria halophila]
MSDEQQAATPAVEKDRVVRVYHVMRDDDGAILADSRVDGFEYIHGHGNLIPGLEAALEGHVEGDEIEVTVEPEQAYGLHDPEGVVEVPRERIEAQAELAPGNMVQAHGPEGRIEMLILEVGDQTVKVDLNHPLAGFRLHFTARVGAIRDAHADEIKHGRVHPGGHHLMTSDSSVPDLPGHESSQES